MRQNKRQRKKNRSKQDRTTPIGRRRFKRAQRFENKFWGLFRRKYTIPVNKIIFEDAPIFRYMNEQLKKREEFTGKPFEDHIVL